MINQPRRFSGVLKIVNFFKNAFAAGLIDGEVNIQMEIGAKDKTKKIRKIG